MNSKFPKALRKAFQAKWPKKYGPSEIWDDSESVRKSFLAKDGGAASTEVPKVGLHGDVSGDDLRQIFCHTRQHRQPQDSTRSVFEAPRSTPWKFSLMCSEPTRRPGRNACSGDRPTPTPEKFSLT